MKKTTKIGIIGAGHVGSHVASSLMTQGLCDEIVLLDTDEGKARRHADDIADSVAYMPLPAKIYAGGYEAVSYTHLGRIAVESAVPPKLPLARPLFCAKKRPQLNALPTACLPAGACPAFGLRLGSVLSGGARRGASTFPRSLFRLFRLTFLRHCL